MSSSPLERVMEANRAVEAGRVDEGLALLRAALADATVVGRARAFAHMLLVSTLIGEKRAAEAEAAARAALEEPGPDDEREQLRFKLASALAAAGRTGEAIAAYRSLVGEARSDDAGTLRREAWLEIAALSRHDRDEAGAREAHRQLVRELVRQFLVEPTALILDREDAETLGARVAERFPGDEAAQITPLVMLILARLAEGEPAEAQGELVARVAAILAALFPDDLATAFPTRDELAELQARAQGTLEENRALLERGLAFMRARR